MVATSLGVQRRQQAIIDTGYHAAIAVMIFLTLAALGVLQALLTDNFRLQYVANHSNRALPVFFKFTSLWAGMEGSLLFWAWMLSAYGFVCIMLYWRKQTLLLPYVTAVTMAVAAFFIAMIVFVTDPFATLPQVPPDGRGLNPLLQHWAMVIHPPVLYMGYVGFTVPFAFALAALLSGQVGNEWLKIIRRWTLIPWFFLGMGMMLGGKWAYMELGWGGYWAWDPVENAALMPWLTGTAFVHSVIIQEKKNMLRVWNMVLIILTFTLCIFGTFLTRSGVISSVHSFTQSSLGPLFLSFVGLIATFSFTLLGTRLHLLKNTVRMDSVVSRESAFLLNNVVFLGACFAVFWGTLFPVLSEAVRGIKITVGAPWFNSVMVPISLLLLLLTGVGPLVAWRKSSLAYLKKIFMLPALGLLGTLVILLLAGMRHFYALISFALSVFVTLTIVAEFHRGAIARAHSNSEPYPVALWRLLIKNRRRYGGYIVHFGMVLIFVGVTGQAFRAETESLLKPGESVTIRNYELVYQDTRQFEDPNKVVVESTVIVKRDGKVLETIYPQKHFYLAQQQPTTEVALFSNLREDLYVVLGEHQPETHAASFHVYLTPLVAWVWIGGVVMTIGTIIILWPESRQRAGKAAAARVLTRQQRVPVND
ncbi:MAG: heme lyase CcmF/NrfE family subunit [candidate division KSB1 bacterium]|nr:heme lyase CcmF/NrfE family subunit [candidate division KSB1 bacterium]MDZ7302167.1 heme lyase CcmF/NrfE family subunit [candidate division KSB1 bacterium]MDZ7311276.1 heme lyase CcmF/NrfE family subunit [candidate division KSB1 bacterium]